MKPCELKFKLQKRNSKCASTCYKTAYNIPMKNSTLIAEMNTFAEKLLKKLIWYSDSSTFYICAKMSGAVEALW